MQSGRTFWKRQGFRGTKMGKKMFCRDTCKTHFPNCSENGLIVVIGSVLLYRKKENRVGTKVRSC